MALGAGIGAAMGAGGGSLGTLYVRLAADTTNLVSGMSTAKASVSGAAGVIAKGLAAMTTAVVGLGVASVVEFAKFESSFAGVRKTVDATEEEFSKLASTFRKMATELPTNVNEINRIAEAAGQLGIHKSTLAGFTKTMIDLGNTTNLKGEQGATQLARFAKITQMAEKDFDRLGSTIVALGNAMPTTEAEIVSMGLRIAGAGSQVGMTEHEILGFAAALSSVGVSAEMGGTAISQTMIRMSKAVAMGSDELKLFADIAGSTVGEFQELFQNNAQEAVLRFIEGLNAFEKAGGNVFQILEKLNIDGARLTDILTRAAGAGNTFRNSLNLGAKAWEENNAMTKEAAERYKTLASQWTITLNLVRELALQIGEAMAPSVRQLNADFQASLKSSDGWAAGLVHASKEAIPKFISGLRTIRDGLEETNKKFVAFWESPFGQWLDKGITAIQKHHAEKLRQNAEFYRAQDGKLMFPTPSRGSFLNAGKVSGLGTAGMPKELQFNLDTMFKDGIISANKATEAVGGLTDGMRALNAESLKTKLSVDEVLNALNLPDGKDFLGRDRKNEHGQVLGMTKAEMGLASMSGLGMGADQGVMQALGLTAELDANREKLRELENLAQQELNLNEETNLRLLQARKVFMAQEKALINAQRQFVLGTSSKMFDDLAGMAEMWAGKQSGFYKAMFAASKAFAIAESIIKIQQGIANAASMPWPANLAAIASVVSATANIVSTIQSVKLEFGGERAEGGPVGPGKAFLVGEEGPELFVPRGGGNIVPNDVLSGGGKVKVVINNFTDATPEVKERKEGEERIIEVIIQRAKTEIASDIRDQKGIVPRAMESTYRLRRGM